VRTASCIVAAGRGIRLGKEFSRLPKAMVPILGRAMLYYSLHAFDLTPDTGDIVIAAPPDQIDTFEKALRIWGFSRQIRVVAGGETRSQSVINALKALTSESPDRVLIHDAARACVTSEMIEAVVKASEGGSAATLASAVADTLRIAKSGAIAGEIDRSEIAAIETPQAFPYKKLLELHAGSPAGNDLTDDTTFFTRAGESVKLVFHEDSNLKITFPEDLAAAEGILFVRGWQDASEGED
jgi:2-C-methyl-D-erythritol 4-phosphate cytidylyltransferase